MTRLSNRYDCLYPKLRLFLLFLGCFPLAIMAGPMTVDSPAQLQEAVKKARPGDTILLKAGEWRDAELKVQGDGTPDAPIHIRAERPGEVILTGRSNLRISGSHLVVEGLVFRDGHTPTSEVISFRTASGVYANHCRLTHCVIDNFNHTERTETEAWVVLYGRHNRVDHCYFNDKRVSGVTLVVRLLDEACRENQHRIDHNYFGYRQALGSNGGETIRIGTSTYSMSQSLTEIVNNVFDRCGGETEIISIKSCGNRVAGNLFHECQGSVVFRHGHDNRVEGNWFIGNGVPETGGVRIINERNTVLNNVFRGLTGRGFRAPVVVMNGVPNSPLNRYHQVVGAEILGNTFEKVSPILLGAGSDAERSLPPIQSTFQHNRIIASPDARVFDLEDTVDGIQFSGNHYEPPSLRPPFEAAVQVESEDPDTGSTLAAPPSLESFRLTGAVGLVGWRDPSMQFANGRVIAVAPGVDTLSDAVQSAASGDILELQAGGIYGVEKNIDIRVPLTLRRAPGSGDSRPVIRGSKATLFRIENGGGLRLEGLELVGSLAPDRAGNHLIATSRYSMNRNYELHLDDCVVRKLDSNHSFDFFHAFPSTFATAITLKRSHFENITGSVLVLDAEKDALGRYSVENLECQDCTFSGIQGPAIRAHRLGTDESTFGPTVTLINCAFKNVGQGKRNTLASSIDLHGAQGVSLIGCHFEETMPVSVVHTNGDPQVLVTDCVFDATGGVKSNAPGFVWNAPSSLSTPNSQSQFP
jgi:poly(beta-D-mannuronate) lyase